MRPILKFYGASIWRWALGYIISHIRNDVHFGTPKVFATLEYSDVILSAMVFVQVHIKE